MRHSATRFNYVLFAQSEENQNHWKVANFTLF